MLKPTINDKRILHVGNIAQNAFWNAQTLLKYGFESDLLIADYYHIAGSPIWLKLTKNGISKEDIGDDFFPNFFRFPSAAYTLPKFVAQGPQAAAITYLILRRLGQTQATEAAWNALTYWRFKATALRNTIIDAVQWRESDFENNLRDLCVADEFMPSLREGREAERYQDEIRNLFRLAYNDVVAKNLNFPHSPNVTDAAFAVYAQKNGCENIDKLVPCNDEHRWVASMLRLVRDYRKIGKTHAFLHEVLAPPEQVLPSRVIEGLLAEDVQWISGVRGLWQRLFECYRYRVCYATSGMFALLSGSEPYVAYEHGTIRSLPFEKTQIGRLTRATYENASCTLVTNADYVVASRRLEFAKSRMFYCPHGFDHEAANQYLKESSPRALPVERILFIAPARHDWKQSDPGNEKGNNRIIEALGILHESGVTNISVTFIAYGRDVEASRDLIEKRGVGHLCHWIEPQPLQKLWELYCEHHAVLDQFLIPAIGAIGVESLALGRRLITHDTGALAEFFGEQPPLYAAHTALEIAEAMRKIIADPADSTGIGTAARKWFCRRHSDTAVSEAFKSAFKQIEVNYSAPSKGAISLKSIMYRALGARRQP